MTEQEKPLDKEQLEYAHRFAAEHHMHENRAFWTRVAALLLGNSFLVAGFASLYGSIGHDSPLLLAIAASGIAIQALWPLFAKSSYTVFQYWRNLMRAIEKYPSLESCHAEKRRDIERRVKEIWSCYSDSPWWSFTCPEEGSNKPPTAEKDEATGGNKKETGKNKRALGEIIRHFWENYPAGAFAIVMFFVVFLAIWTVATAIVDIRLEWLGWRILGRVLSIGVPLLIVGIASAIACTFIWKGRKNAPIKAIR